MYYINIVIDYNKRYILIIILMIYYITKTEHMYPLKHSLGTALSPSLSSVYINFTYMIVLTKRSHVAPKMQHVTFCDSIVRFDWCSTERIDSVCGVTWIPLCPKDGSVIKWGRGEGETLSIHVVSTQCADGLRVSINHKRGTLVQHEGFKRLIWCNVWHLTRCNVWHLTRCYIWHFTRCNAWHLADIMLDDMRNVHSSM